MNASAYATAIYGCSALSLLANAIFLALYLRCPSKTINVYKHFFAVTALHDIAVATIMALCVPRSYHSASYYITISTGLIQQWQTAVVLLMLFWFALSSSLLILTNSFLYRYIHVCRPELSYLYTSKRWLLLIYGVNVLFLSNFAFLTIMNCLPNDAFRAQIYAELAAMNVKAFIGASLINRDKQLSTLLRMDAIAVLLLISFTGFYCAVRTHMTLKRGGISSHVKRLQRQMFRVLLFQTACPTLFIYLPSGAIHVILIGNVDTVPLVVDSIELLFSLYPLFNPLVTMFSIRDYRGFLFSLLCPGQGSQQVQPLSSIASRTVTVFQKRNT